jgi:hypothetical protein
MLGLRDKGLAFTKPIENLHTISIDETILVIPCHYNVPAFFSKKYNPADDKMFKQEVEKLCIDCVIMGKGHTLNV